MKYTLLVKASSSWKDSGMVTTSNILHKKKYIPFKDYLNQISDIKKVHNFL